MLFSYRIAVCSYHAEQIATRSSAASATAATAADAAAAAAAAVEAGIGMMAIGAAFVLCVVFLGGNTVMYRVVDGRNTEPFAPIHS